MSGIQILIVEDELIIARDIERQLIALGHRPVGLATSGEEAVALAAALQPRLVLMDIQLSGAIDGVDAALAIRARSGTPVIFLTAYTTDDVLDRAKVAEPAGYLIKPFEPTALRTTIEIAMHNHGLASQVRLQSAALNAAANAIVITDREGVIQWVNPAFSQLTGYLASEAIGANPRDLVRSGVHPREFYQDMWLALLAGKVWEGELTNRRKDGTHYVEQQTITPVRNDAGEITHFIAIKRDLTEQRRLQAQFLQAQKTEVVGRLAGGVAHDFNNLLTVINGTADLALMDLPEGHPMRREFAHIKDAGDQAARLTRQLLSFSRKQVVDPVVVNVGDNIKHMAGLLRRLIGEDIVLVVVASPELDAVVIDPGQLEQVLLNLAMNARDAMPHGGVLTVETSRVTVDEGFAAGHAPLAAGPYVMVTVTDTGIGVTDEVRRRMFDPFFTTKESGRGTGLGLATVDSIVKQAGGCIAVDSEPGHGATFRVYLPIATRSSSEVAQESPRRARGSETILVVEDEDGLREVVTRMLRGAGFTVIHANGARQALELLESHRYQVHLVFTDVVMPGMSGVDLVTAILAAQPRIKVLFASGYTADATLNQVALARARNFIAKPYTVAGLTKKIRDVLDA